MLAILKKEINSFFASPIGYLVIAIFLVLNGLFLWLFKGEFNISLIPTLLYVYTVYQLGNPVGNLDMGSTLGSYFGLLFLVAAYTAIGVFASTLSDNQIVAFISAVFICFLFYIGFEGIGEFMSSDIVEQLGMSTHFKSMSRGVLDTRDIVYFLSVTVFFLLWTKLNINKAK